MNNKSFSEKKTIKMWVLLSLALQRFGSAIPDGFYLRLVFYCRMGYRLHLKTPRSFSEKLQWLKINDRKEEYTTLVDKHEVKDHIKAIIGAEHIIPSLGVWKTCNEIEWDKLPNKFVLKTTHGGGGSGVVVCKDKKTFDKESAVRQLKNSLKQSIYKEYREWPYKNIKPQIIAEQYLEQEDGSELIDYKFFCFNGQPKFLYVRQPSETSTLDFITMDWEAAPFRRIDSKPSLILPTKPLLFDEMKDVATKLASGFPFVRVDLYVVARRVYFSELTFYPSSGLLPFEPREWDFKLGELLELPQIKR